MSGGIVGGVGRLPADYVPTGKYKKAADRVRRIKAGIVLEVGAGVKDNVGNAATAVVVDAERSMCLLMYSNDQEGTVQYILARVAATGEGLRVAAEPDPVFFEYFDEAFARWQAGIEPTEES